MPFVSTFSISGQAGKIGYVRGDAINFNQLFSGVPQYYAGSVIQVEEILTIYTDVVRPSVVDVDYDWFVNKQYLGTYQILGTDAQANHYEGDDGYLVDTIQKIRRYSNYTITANPDVPIALSEGFVVYDCNFYTVAEVYLFPGTNTPLPGFRLREPGEGKPIFRGYSTLTRADLADTPFNALIGGVGLYLRPGVEGVQIVYEAAIINDIYTANQPMPVSTCELVQPSCQEQFSAFLASSPTEAFPNQTACDVYNNITPPGQPNSNCEPAIWVCPSDPSTQFTYYQFVGR